MKLFLYELWDDIDLIGWGCENTLNLSLCLTVCTNLSSHNRLIKVMTLEVIGCFDDVENA